MIACWSKNLGIPINEVLYEHSMVNLLLYSASLPQYDDIEWDESKDASNPRNFASDNGKEVFI